MLAKFFCDAHQFAWKSLELVINLKYWKYLNQNVMSVKHRKKNYLKFRLSKLHLQLKLLLEIAHLQTYYIFFTLTGPLAPSIFHSTELRINFWLWCTNNARQVMKIHRKSVIWNCFPGSTFQKFSIYSFRVQANWTWWISYQK